ncbi:uncharacterized protein LOC144213660 [Stigmatopora nigra]
MPLFTRLLFVLLAPLCTNILPFSKAISAGARSQSVITEMSPFWLSDHHGRPSPGLQSSQRYSDSEPVQADKNIGRYSVVILKSAPGQRMIPTNQRGGPRFQSISAARSPPSSGAKTLWQKPSGHWSRAPRTQPGPDASSFKAVPSPRANVKPGQSVFQPSFVRREDFGKALNLEAFSRRNQRPQKHSGGMLAQGEDASRYQARPSLYLPPNSLWSRIPNNSGYRFQISNENWAPMSKYSFGQRQVEVPSTESGSGPQRLQKTDGHVTVGRSDKPTVKQVLPEREPNLFTSPVPGTKPHPSQTTTKQMVPPVRSRLFGASSRVGLELGVPIVRLPRQHTSTTPSENRRTTTRPDKVHLVPEGQNLKTTESVGSQVWHIRTKVQDISELNYLRISMGNVTFESV